MNDQNAQNDDKFFFYYLRSFDKTPYACVCLKEADGKWCRGIAICSPAEKAFEKAKARNIAKGRCLSAIERKDNSYIIGAREFRDNASFVYQHLNPIGSINAPDYKEVRYKSEYDTFLAPHEKRIVRLTPMNCN